MKLLILFPLLIDCTHTRGGEKEGWRRDCVCVVWERECTDFKLKKRFSGPHSSVFFLTKNISIGEIGIQALPLVINLQEHESISSSLAVWKTNKEERRGEERRGEEMRQTTRFSALLHACLQLKFKTDSSKDGMDQENSKTQAGNGEIRKIQKNKKERMDERKRKRIACTWRFPYWCVLHRLGTPSGYCPRVTVPQENPVVLEPRL